MNVYLLLFYELYYLLFHCGFEVVELRKTRGKFAQICFAGLLYPSMRISSFQAVIHAEEELVQRVHYRQDLKNIFHPALLLSDKIVVLARKIDSNENRTCP